MVRKAFTLIELIISILVIGIALMSIPLFLSSSNKSDEFALEQESVLAAKTKIQNITSYKWDENSEESSTGKIRILDTHNGDNELQRFTCPPLPLGFFCWMWNLFFPQGGMMGQAIGDGRREMFSSVTYPNINETNHTNPNDIDDFNNEILIGLSNQESTNLDYLNSSFNMGVRVGFVNDSANYRGSKTISFNFPSVFKASGDSNIKMVEVNVSNVNTPFFLRYYSCNIGESEIRSKLF